MVSPLPGLFSPFSGFKTRSAGRPQDPSFSNQSLSDCQKADSDPDILEKWQALRGELQQAQ